MITKEYFHQNSALIIDVAKLESIRQTLIKTEWQKRQTTKEFRSALLRHLAELGWSDRVRIDQRSNINISSVFHEIGYAYKRGI
jgi:hypothetical protein